jgi:glycosyltransferase involved in cell wall biosynthesis
MVVAAGYHREKNMLGLVRALALRRQRGAAELRVDWYGAVQSDRRPFDDAIALTRSLELDRVIKFHPPTREIEVEYQRADGVGLFSEYEGLPNTICEAMACGRPVVMSDVCDARYLVQDGVNGLLCDPSDPSSIADALDRFTALGHEARTAMGAERLFSPDAILPQYETVLSRAC